MVPKDVTPWSRDEADDVLLHRAVAAEVIKRPRGTRKRTVKR